MSFPETIAILELCENNNKRRYFIANFGGNVSTVIHELSWSEMLELQAPPVSIQIGNGLKPIHVIILILQSNFFSYFTHGFNVKSIQNKAAFSVITSSPTLHLSLKECCNCHGTVGSFFNFCVFQPIPEPRGGRLIQVEGYWISVGDSEPTIDETYILTSSVKLNLRDIVRVVSAGCVDLFSC